MPVFEFSSTSEEVASAWMDEIRGKNVLITGTSQNGLGFEAARVIAKYANLVVITGYNAERLKLSQEALKQEIPDANIRPLVLNLASLADVRTAAAEVNAYPEHIDILMNNAASSFCPFKLTPDGFEHQMATGHLGPFLFTALILPKLLAAGPKSRVVFVASGAHAWCDGVNLAEMQHPNEATYEPMRAYAQTKSANILTASEFARRAEGRVKSYSLTPGAIMTNFVTKNMSMMSEDEQSNLGSAFVWKTIPQGAATLLVAAFDPSLNDKPGCYLKDSVVSDESVKPHASDSVQADRLWTLSEKLVGVKFF